MKKILVLALLALAPMTLNATPTRLLAIDNMNQIVPDDWDATTYYSLSPNFKNHWYADSYASGKSFAWAFLDIKIGTLVVWYNKDFEGGPVYDAAAAVSSIGITESPFGTDVVNAWEPREYRIKAPDTKLGLGYAMEVLDNLNLGLCFRLARQNNTKDIDFRDGNGNGTSLGSSTAYQSTLGYPVLGVANVGNRQNDNALLLSPQFSYNGESFTLDAKFDMFWPGIDNAHTESLISGSSTGSVTQTLKDKNRMNWAAKPKLRYMFSPNSSLMLRGSYGKLDLSADHRVTGAFSGPAFNAFQAAGYDFTDASQDTGIDVWDAFLGVVNSWGKGKGLVTWGIGVTGQTLKLAGTTFQTAATAASYNDVVKNVVTNLTDNKLTVPVVIGTELSLTPWCKARGSVQRNFFTATSTNTVAENYNNSGVLTSRKTTDVSSDFLKEWAFNTGFGLNFGQFSWDTALNTTFLASSNAAFTNPLFQSSFTYEF